MCQPGTEVEVTGQRSLKAASERRLGVLWGLPTGVLLDRKYLSFLTKASQAAGGVGSGVCQAMNWDRCKVLRRWLLSALGKPGETGRLKPSWEGNSYIGVKVWHEGGIKEAHSWAHASPLTLTALPFFYQMKLWILTSPVSPASQDISRTLLPLQPAANPIPGESAPSQTSPQLQEALLLSFPSSLASYACLAVPTPCVPRAPGTKENSKSSQSCFLHRCEAQGLVEAAPGSASSDTLCRKRSEPGERRG